MDLELDAGNARRSATEWKSGTHLRIIDVVRLFGGEAGGSLVVFEGRGRPRFNSSVRIPTSENSMIQPPKYSQSGQWISCRAVAVIMFLATNGSWQVADAGDVSEHVEARTPQKLPEFRYVRTLSAPNEFYLYGRLQSGTSQLTWSADGERLAAYIRNGLAIAIWSPDGKYQFEFPRHARFGLNSYLLGFLRGHGQVVASPAADTNNPDEEEKVEELAFSVMDAATGKVLQGVAGPNPGKTFRENIAEHQAISPDQKLIAVAYHPYAGRSIGVYSTDSWQRIATIDVGDIKGSAPQALAFSPDSTKLAIARGLDSRVDIVDVGSWTLLRSIEPFPETPPPKHVRSLTAIAFSPDGAMIAVGSHSGGTYWRHSDGSLAPNGVGSPVEEFPPDPLRVFRVDDGSLVASAANFPGGFADEHKFAWMPSGEFIVFIDADRWLRLWSPAHPKSPDLVLKLGRDADWLVFSPQGTQMAINFANGVQIFDILDPK